MPRPHDANFASLASLMAAGLKAVDTKPFGDGREAESKGESNDRAP